MSEFCLTGKRIFLAGHTGMVGSGFLRHFESCGMEVIVSGRRELDLTNQMQVKEFLNDTKPDVVIVAAAKVGGIQANIRLPAEFLYENLMIESNLIHGAKLCGVTRLLLLGSSCIYPRDCVQPIKEEYLLTGPLEQSNEAYAIAKIAGIKLCQSYRSQFGCKFISCQPTNLYGPNDNFNLETSHVLPALIRRFHDAKVSDEGEVVIWGSGNPRREFLHVDDLVSAGLFLLENFDGPEPINIGWGKDLTIRELSELVAVITGYGGRIKFDTSRPDGTPQKLLDNTLIQGLGWKPRISLRDGISKTYQWYLQNQESVRL